MEHQLKYKGNDNFILEQCRKNNEPIPDYILNAPKLEKGLMFYLQAFFDLETTRVIGMSVSPIPFTAIIQYCEYAQIKDSDFKSDFIYIIQSLDRFVMDFYQKQNKE